MPSKIPQDLSPEQKLGVAQLQKAGDQYFNGVTDSWPVGESDAAEKKLLLSDIAKVGRNYPGGLPAYVEKAKHFLELSRQNVNTLSDVVPEVPNGMYFPSFSKVFSEYETLGVDGIKGLCMVLVAGGLGERLGYSGIKVALPTNICTGLSYLGYYCEWIQALQDLSDDSSLQIPFVIMTSGDTHEQTEKLFKDNAYFGLSPNQVELVQQEKVPALLNNKADLAFQSPYKLLTKPHGNGDVHLLLHQTGIAQKWVREGRKHIVFFQDTNGLAFNTVLPTLGLAMKNNFSMTSVCVPRKAGEAIGCITSLKNKKTDNTIVCNVEYNQISSLLQSTKGHGDIADPKTGLSEFPGNTNTLVIEVTKYAKVLSETSGIMPEFVNPKYTNDSRNEFKAPTRLECMMEDYPKLLDNDDKVGFASFDRWISFSPCKNNLAEARVKSSSGLDAWGAFTAEVDFYNQNANILSQLGINVEPATDVVMSGVSAKMTAMIWLSPGFVAPLSKLPSHFPTPQQVNISRRSCLIINGAQVKINQLNLDGALVISTCHGAEVIIKSLTVKNEGWVFVERDDSALVAPERIRGYTINRKHQMVLNFTRPGRYVVDDTARL